MKKKQFPGGNGIRFMPVDGLAAVAARAEGDDEAKRFEVAFSSEKEVVRYGWFGNWREVLGHEAGEVQMARFESGRANMLEEHRGAPIGVIEAANIDKDKKGRATVRTSRTARGKDAALDMEDDTRTNISVGYIPKRARLVEEDKDKGDLWRVTLWEPVELSLVGVPADDDVGKDRSVRSGYPPVETEGEEPEEERAMTMKKVRDEKGALIEVPESDPRPAATERATVQVLDVEGERKAIRAEEKERRETIRALVKMNDLPAERAEEMVDAGDSVVVATRKILLLRETKGLAQPPSETLDGMSAKDRKEWSLIRAVRLGAGITAREKGSDPDEFGRFKFDGLEAEVHRELLRGLPEGVERRGGILIPMDLRTREERMQAIHARTLATNVPTKGAETIFDTPGEFIELLRSATMVLRRGGRVLTGLTGPVGFVKQSGGVTVSWVGENPAADVAESDLLLAIVTMAQKTLQSTTGYTRQLLLQSSLEIEAMARQEFAEAHSRAIDRAAMHGIGAAGQPMGIYFAPGVSATAMGGVPTFGKLIDMETQVAVANAIRGALGWITTPGMAGKMMQTLVASAAGSDMIWKGPFEEGVMANYPASSTTQLATTMNGSEEAGGTSHGLIFGNWSEVVFGLFNSTEIVVDPYRLKKRGIIEVTSFQMADLILRHGESFSKATGATIV